MYFSQYFYNTCNINSNDDKNKYVEIRELTINHVINP